ncbi:hypothetical protein LBMAG42_39400 [Deltaproteobacteria bacterium]|nr:hypothetical protein LBMAG42_39400 [Deltaproteobacteria bacterium]
MTSRADDPLDNRVALETPEHVELRVSLAGPAARGLAWGIDAAIRVVVLGVLGSFVLGIGGEGIGTGAWLILLFVMDWAWYVFWEWLDDGRSPGKRVMHLRVMRLDGTPVGPREVMLRNLVRVADALPGLYFVGAASAFADARFRRLGDIVAGTIVVREERVEEPPAPVAIEPALSEREVPVLPRHRRITAGDRRALEEWASASTRFGLVWSEWVAGRVVDAFAARYRVSAGRPVRVLQRLLGAARAVQPELERAAGAGRDETAALRRLLDAHTWRGVDAARSSEIVWHLRAVVAELGRLRDVSPSRARAAEEVIWEAELLIHRSRPASVHLSVEPVRRFLFEEFPAALHRNLGWFGIASALFWVPFVLCALGAAFDPDVAARLLPPGVRGDLEDWYLHPDSRSADQNATMAGFYVLNNVGIALRAAGAGVLGGLGTAWVLVSNGIAIGSTTGYLASVGALGNLLRFTSGHTAWELTAILIAGASGLRLGAALVAPGDRTRAASLRLAGPDVLRLAGGAATMLLVAAMIEGFWSGWMLPDVVKAVFGLVQVGLVVLWLSGVRRR